MSRATVTAIAAILETDYCRAVLVVEIGGLRGRDPLAVAAAQSRQPRPAGRETDDRLRSRRLRSIASRMFAGATIQCYREHWMRNALYNVPAAHSPAVRAMLMTIFAEVSQGKTVAH